MTNTLSAEEAAKLLHIDVRRVQALARAKKLPAVRVGRRWLFPREKLEDMLGASAPVKSPPSSKISARNRLKGVIRGLRVDGLMAEVILRIGRQEVVAVITRSSAERLGLKVGDEAYAMIKATEVIIGRD